VTYNPYTDGTHPNSDWHCIVCGAKLDRVSRKNKHCGKEAWEAMIKDETQWFICSNQYCQHRTVPLILHHPTLGPASPAENSYSISWVK